MSDSILSLAAMIISVGGALAVISKVLKVAYRLETLEEEVKRNKQKLETMGNTFNTLLDKLEDSLSEINIKLARLETKLENK
jgi:archaellum component FlaC